MIPIEGEAGSSGGPIVMWVKGDSLDPFVLGVYTGMI